MPIQSSLNAGADSIAPKQMRKGEALCSIYLSLYCLQSLQPRPHEADVFLACEGAVRRATALCSAPRILRNPRQ